MPHETDLIAALALGLTFAFFGGLLATRLRLPPLVGYLMAGVAVGPFTPGFVADAGIAAQLAEIGVILLMFGVGLHFSFKDLLSVRAIAVPGAVVQITLATLLGLGASQLWGWTWGQGVVFGLCLSVASTVVLLRALEERGAVNSLNGRIAVGWLIVEDLAMVLALVLLPAFAGVLGGNAPEGGGAPLLATLALTLGKVALFVAVMLLVGTRVVPWLLERVATLGSRELFTLAVLAIALGIAYESAVLFDVSFALGAFFAGMIVSESRLSHQAAQDALPLQDAFAVLFFVSVGMLFDFRVLLERPLEVLVTVVIIVLGKSIGAFAIVRLLRYPTGTALAVSAALAQIGEFSFILAGLGLSLNLLPPEGLSLILAGAILSITLNPFVFRAAEAWGRRLDARTPATPHGAPGGSTPAETELALSELARTGAALSGAPKSDLPLADAARSEADLAGQALSSRALAGHAVIVGYGRVGQVVSGALQGRGLAYRVIEQNRQAVHDLQRQGVPAVYGDASAPEVLEQSALEDARLLIVATPDPLEARLMIQHARRVNPDIVVIARSQDAHEGDALRKVGATHTLVGEHELGRAMGELALSTYTPGERGEPLGAFTSPEPRISREPSSAT